jgi:hypothetical protein
MGRVRVQLRRQCALLGDFGKNGGCAKQMAFYNCKLSEQLKIDRLGVDVHWLYTVCCSGGRINAKVV